MTDPPGTSESPRPTIRPLHVVVVVMGDLGRSPRMQYHAVSLLQQGYFVSLLGYTGEDLIPDLTFPKRLTVHRFATSSPPPPLRKIPLVYYVWRLCSLVYNLTQALETAFAGRTVDCVVCQNPPAIPLLVLAYARCRLQQLFRGVRAALIIDWHNLSYSMLRDGSLLACLAKRYERTASHLADGHLCVTAAMKRFLLRNDFLDREMTATTRVLYDCPPSMFRPLKLTEQHAVLKQVLSPNHIEGVQCPRSWYEGLDPSCETLFTTEQRDGKVVSRRGRPAFVTSSTSWTPDEDFGTLLEALATLDDRISTEQSALRVLVLVTGKGPMKEFYVERLSKLPLTNVAVQTMWLTPEDYPKLLACADLGISLHTSTSGLDLPMKVLDLFGCHVPVCAYNFECLSELVQDGVNGRVFETSKQLADQLFELLTPLATGTRSNLQTYAQNLRDRTRWQQNWIQNALPAIEGAVSMHIAR